jgi:hypothetical protein
MTDGQSDWMRVDESELERLLSSVNWVFDEWAIRKRGPDRFEFECPFPGDDGWSRCGERSTVVESIRAALIACEEWSHGEGQFERQADP